MQIDYKDLKQEFNLIYFLEETKNNPIFFCNHDEKTENSFFKVTNKFSFKTNKKIETSSSKFRFQNLNKEVLNIHDNFSIKILSSNIQTSNFNESIFNINSFCSENFKEDFEGQYRLVIPNSTNDKIRFEDFFTNFNCMITINDKIFEGIEFKIQNHTLQFYRLNDYFVVESKNSILFKEFNEYTRVILSSFGFLTGFAPMDYGYFFTYNNYKEGIVQYMFTSNFIETYKTSYSIIDLNPYNYYQNQDLDFNFDQINGFKNDNRIEKLQKDLKPITSNIFETLCENMINNEKFAEVIYSILSINNSTKTALGLKCALYSVVLEMITNIISDENKDKLYFIQEKKLRKELQKNLNNHASEFFEKNEIGIYKDSPIKKRIDNLNSPTNQDKLLAPFKILEINLTESDKKILNNRNIFPLSKRGLCKRNSLTISSVTLSVLVAVNAATVV